MIAVVDRTPIRIRLTLAFAVAMAVVLGATGFFVYVRLESALDQTLNAGLRSRADDVAALIGQADAGLSEGRPTALAERGESFAQVIASDGTVVDTTPQLGRGRLLDASALARALRRTTLLEHGPLPGIDSPSRLLATPVHAQGRSLVVVVGASLEARDAALQGLLSQMLIGGPAALLVALLAGYALTGSALRPVERMRARAGAISASAPGQRLPVPAARDEIQRLGTTLNEMLARLETALERERSFVADASHELRTPLALLKIELELALRRTRTPAEIESALRSAADETDRLVQLTEDLLVLARSDQGQLPLRAEPVDARAILQGVVDRYALRAAQADRSIDLAAAAGLTFIGDRLRLEQAIANLVENAFRHGRGAIHLSSIAGDQSVELHVRDEGPGFPDGFLPRAFDRFSRADEDRGGGGAGLGLAIVDVVARAHGGSAHAATSATGGADAWISLPRS